MMEMNFQVTKVKNSKVTSYIYNRMIVITKGEREGEQERH